MVTVPAIAKRTNKAIISAINFERQAIARHAMQSGVVKFLTQYVCALSMLFATLNGVVQEVKPGLPPIPEPKVIDGDLLAFEQAVTVFGQGGHIIRDEVTQSVATTQALSAVQCPQSFKIEYIADVDAVQDIGSHKAFKVRDVYRLVLTKSTFNALEPNPFAQSSVLCLSLIHI